MMSGTEEPVAITLSQSTSARPQTCCSGIKFRLLLQINYRWRLTWHVIQICPPQKPSCILEVGGGTGGKYSLDAAQLLGQPQTQNIHLPIFPRYLPDMHSKNLPVITSFIAKSFNRQKDAQPSSF
jgi:hypothetical protein